jgi:hypothetical protein
MPIETMQGGTIFTGKGLDLFRLVALKSALRLESHGMRAGRGVNARKLAKQETGLKTNDYAKLIAAVEAKIVAMNNTVAHVAVAPEVAWEYRGKTYRTTTERCPQCSADAVTPAPDGVDTSDGTTHVCNPVLGGCDMGFAKAVN